MTSCWVNYHVFLAQLDGRSYRCSPTLDDAAFDLRMDALCWRMPYHLRAFHTSDPKWAAENPALKTAPELPVDIDHLLSALPLQPMRLKDKRRQRTLSVRHNAGPKFHKFSICLRVPGESEPVGVAVASTPKARHQMDGKTLEINRCCTDPRYADVCSCLYARAIRIGRELGYRRFLTYTLPEESGSSLRAVGFQPDGVTKASGSGWDSPSRPRDTSCYPAGEKLRWVLHIP